MFSGDVTTFKLVTNFVAGSEAGIKICEVGPIWGLADAMRGIIPMNKETYKSACTIIVRTDNNEDFPKSGVVFHL